MEDSSTSEGMTAADTGVTALEEVALTSAPVEESAPCEPPQEGEDDSGTHEEIITEVKASKLGGSILRGNHLRKLIKRRSTARHSVPEGDDVSTESGERTSLEGDGDSSYGSHEDLSPSTTSSADRPRSASLRKRLGSGSRVGVGSGGGGGGGDSTSSSREDVAGTVLSRQLSQRGSRRSSNAPNPLKENDTARLLLLFFSTLLGWLLKLLLGLWGLARQFFIVPPEAEGAQDDEEEPEVPGLIPLKPEIKEDKERIFLICNELKTTEEAYVDRLAILVMAKERSAAIVGAAIAKQMFKDIEVIHRFHNDNLLPELKERMEKWEEHQKVGDVMRKLAPFLKLYTEYVKDFQKAAALVDHWENKSSTFAAMIRDIRDTQAEKHGKLKVQAHMIEPIQRVPRYELLLRDYLKRLPKDASDRQDATHALESVAAAASHFEEVMKRDSRIAKLIEIRERLDSSAMNIVLPNREFIAESKLNVFSMKSQKVSEKTIFLFNDLLLVCTRQKMQKFVTSMKFKVKTAIDLREAELVSGVNLDIPYTLLVQTKENHVELCLSSSSEVLQWRQTIQGLIDAFIKTLSRASTGSSAGSLEGVDEEQFECVISSPAQLSGDEGRTWKRRWMVVTSCGKMVAYKTQQDKIPVSWIQIAHFTLESAHIAKRPNTLILGGFSRKYYIQFDTQNDFNEWFEVLQKYQPSSSTDGPLSPEVVDSVSQA